MIHSGHFITGGSLATVVLDGLGGQDRRQFRLYGLCLSATLFFISTVFVGFIFVDATAPLQTVAENARRKS